MKYLWVRSKHNSFQMVLRIELPFGENVIDYRRKNWAYFGTNWQTDMYLNHFQIFLCWFFQANHQENVRSDKHCSNLVKHKWLRDNIDSFKTGDSMSQYNWIHCVRNLSEAIVFLKMYGKLGGITSFFFFVNANFAYFIK